MDARLWGELQRYIDLKEIFGKLPMWEFFQLRLVCKDWNRLASDRTFLAESFRDPIPKPYFVVNAYSVGRRKLACLLTYDASSRRWSSTRLPSFLDLYSGDLVTGGLIHSYHHLRVNQERVFSVHTRTSHTLPEPLQFESSVNPLPTSPFPFRAMAVDATVTPHTFQLILSESSKNPPQIYNSKTNSWTLALSREVALAPGNAICKRSVLYTRYDTHIMAYSPEENTWFQLEPPPGTSDTNRRRIGAWDGRLFDVTMDLEHRLSRCGSLETITSRNGKRLSGFRKTSLHG